jgi:hypothetical protein
MEGPAYLVSNGGAAFPDLDVILSGNGLRIMLHGQTDIKGGHITATFPALPDVPISHFSLDLPQGPYSALAAVGALCGDTLAMPTTITAQNGARITQQTLISVAGCAGAGRGAAAWLSRLRVAPPRFAAAARGASIASFPRPPASRRGGRARKPAPGATVTYTDAEPATTTFTVLRPARGERRGRSCVAPSRRRRHGRAGRACTRYLPVGSFTHHDLAGVNRFYFTGRVGRRKLAPGSYRLQATATSAAARSATLGVGFSIRRG